MSSIWGSIPKVLRTMDIPNKVAMPRDSSKAISMSRKSFLLVVGVGFIVVCLAVAAFVYPTVKTIELESEINSMKRDNEFDKGNLADEVRKNMNDSLSHFFKISGRKSEIDERMEAKNEFSSSTRQNFHKNFTEIKNVLNSLSSTVRNLSEVVSAAKISRLHFSLNATWNELTRTATNVDKMWRQWNRTDRKVEDIVNLLGQQNETFHFKIAYHSDKLLSEVKDLETTQSKFHNDTIISLKKLHTELNKTRNHLENNFNHRIASTNQTWHRTLEHSIGSVRSSITKINTKVDGMKKDLENRIKSLTNKHDVMKDDFSKTKLTFQEKDRKHDDAISLQSNKIESMKSKIAKLEDERSTYLQKFATQEQKMKDLESRVESMENGASPLMKTDGYKHVILPVMIAFYVIYLN